jgi:hypothetical protein
MINFYRPNVLREGSYASGSGSSSSNPQMTPQQLLQLYGQALPQIGNVTSAQATPINTALASSAAAANPIYTGSTLSQLNSLASGFGNAGNTLSTQQGQFNASLLGSPVAQGITNNATSLLNQTNPAQAAANSQAANLVNSINLNGLTGGEQEAVERSLNQSLNGTGNLGLNNSTNAVANAMDFGSALQAKRAALGSALGTATGVSGQQNTNFNPISGVMNLSNPSSNFGLGQFNPTQANSTITTPFNYSTSIFQPLGYNASAPRSTSSSSNQSASAGINCFLTTAVCEWKGLPDDCEELMILRDFRDNYVPKNLVNEYYKIGSELVPKLREQDKEFIWKVVKQCLVAIKQGYNALALQFYENMVNHLRKELLCGTAQV